MKLCAFIISCIWGVSVFAQNPQYAQILKNIKQRKTEWDFKDSSDYNQVMYQTLVDSVFPLWYGTPWDFNGISNIPGKGEIACGYFVSTTLKHVGFELNRYKLAQQASETIVKSVCGNQNTCRYENIERVSNRLKGMGNSLLVVGLDYHVGFIVVQNGIAFFVHSDYINGMVVREKLEESEAFQSSQSYVIGALLPNKMMLEKWLLGIKVY